MARTVDTTMIARMREESEATRDEEYPAWTRATRPNRSQVYSVRLSRSERDAVEAAAQAKHLPASTMVRSWILDRLAQES